MAEKTEQNPTGSPLGKYSVLNLVVKGIDALTGYDRTQSKKYFAPKKDYQRPRKADTSKQ
tara:strand:+ start:44 stop:223 length:180 start_codon:yes stop_codon:yes gene_type:complete